MKSLSHSRLRLVLCASGVFVLGGMIGWAAHALPVFGGTSDTLRGSLLRDDKSGYSLIDPILACDVGPQEAFPEFAPIKNSLTTLIGQEEASGAASSVSVYVRSLKSARWFDINGDEKYAPASMLKVFVMLAYYKESEDDPGVLSRTVAFEGSPNPAEDTPGEVIPHLTNGAPYTIDTLIRQMIVYSDNDALNTLIDAFDQNTLTDFEGIFTDLNIPSPTSQTDQGLDFMSVSEYSLVYRVLFGATYLSQADSQKALELLSQAQYTSGIVAGVPAGTTVAHKFGVATVPATATSSAENELHDCGIVYYPDHPYLLCLMTRGSDFGQLQRDLQDLSRTVYQGLDAYYKSLSVAASSTTTSAAGK